MSTPVRTRRRVPKTGLRRTDKRRAVLPIRLTGAVPAHPPTVDYLAQVSQWNGKTNIDYGTCVVPDTRVLTSDLRWVRAGDVLPGEHLLGFEENGNGHGRAYRRSTVLETAIVPKQCYDLEFGDGTRVRCSADHRWLTPAGTHPQRWITTAEMKCGRVNQSRVVKPLDVWESDASHEAGYLAAAFDGEGCASLDRAGLTRLRFVQADNEMLAEVERCLKECGYRHAHRITSGGRRLRTDGRPRFVKHVIDVSGRSEALRFLGAVRPARLLANLDADRLGRIAGRSARLVSKTPVGVHDVVKLETSARTYFAEGLASHNCGPCMCANSAILTWKALLGLDIAVADEDVFDLYRRSGNPNFDPATDAGDDGVDMTVMLAELVKNGMTITHSDGGRELVKPLLFGGISLAPYDNIHACTSVFGGIGFGLDLDTAQQAQTQKGLWDHVAGSAQWGGHATLGGSYTSATAAHGLDESLISWQMRVGTTPSFLGYQLSEAYGLVWPALWSHPAFQAGVDQAALIADYEALTGRSWAGPPPAQPTPPVPPAPVPPSPLPAGLVSYFTDPAMDRWAAARHTGKAPGGNAWAAQQFLAAQRASGLG
jgi:hypothetical protein